MERYILFCGRDDSPKGGFNDYFDDYETLEEAAIKLPETYDWAHVVDTASYTCDDLSLFSLWVNGKKYKCYRTQDCTGVITSYVIGHKDLWCAARSISKSKAGLEELLKTGLEELLKKL